MFLETVKDQKFMIAHLGLKTELDALQRHSRPEFVSFSVLYLKIILRFP